MDVLAQQPRPILNLPRRQLQSTAPVPPVARYDASHAPGGPHTPNGDGGQRLPNPTRLQWERSMSYFCRISPKLALGYQTKALNSQQNQQATMLLKKIYQKVLQEDGVLANALPGVQAAGPPMQNGQIRPPIPPAAQNQPQNPINTPQAPPNGLPSHISSASQNGTAPNSAHASGPPTPVAGVKRKTSPSSSEPQNGHQPPGPPFQLQSQSQESAQTDTPTNARSPHTLPQQQQGADVPNQSTQQQPQYTAASISASVHEVPNNPSVPLPSLRPTLPISSASKETAAAPPLPDLSAEIQRIDRPPINGGGFGDIWIGERLGQEKVAMKKLRAYADSEQIRRRFLAEVTIWSQLRHDNILEFYGICEDGSSIYMVSPWLENSNVVRYCTRIAPTANRLKLLSDAATGLLYLHNLSPPIVHGDLKCANILVKDDGTACLCDFGLTKIHEEVTSPSLRGAGSSRYMAPELLVWENETLPLKTLASDCYAMGQVIIELLSGERPMPEIPHDFLVWSALSKGYTQRRPDTAIARQWLSDRVWLLVIELTAHVKERRPTMQEVTPRLRSFWLTSASRFAGE